MVTFQAAKGPYLNIYHEYQYICYCTLVGNLLVYFGYRLYIIGIQFLIPMMILIFCYTKIGLTLMSSLAKQKAMQEGSNK